MSMERTKDNIKYEKQIAKSTSCICMYITRLADLDRLVQGYKSRITDLGIDDGGIPWCLA